MDYKLRVRKPEPTIFDFQNIPYIYGGTCPATGLDCFTLYNFIRYKYNREVVNGFEEFYKYGQHRDMPKDYLKEISIETFGEPNGEIGKTKLPFILNDWGGVYGFSTTVDYLGKPYMVTTSTKKGSAVLPLGRFKGRIVMSWDLSTSSKDRIEKVESFYGEEIC